MMRSMAVAIGLTAAALAACLYIYFFRQDALAEQVPVHWNIDFEPDQWTPRANAIWYFLLFPGVMALIVLLAFVLPWLSPKHFEIDRFRSVFAHIMTLIVALFGFFMTLQLWAAFNDRSMPGHLFLGGFFLFFALIGNLMGKVQRNFWMGVRTPWTLASERVWNQTHRVTAWLWTAGGLIGCLAVLAGVPVMAWMIGLLVIALVPVVYSLWLYKHLEKQGKLFASVEYTAHEGETQ